MKKTKLNTLSTRSVHVLALRWQWIHIRLYNSITNIVMESTSRHAWYITVVQKVLCRGARPADNCRDDDEYPRRPVSLDAVCRRRRSLLGDRRHRHGPVDDRCCCTWPTKCQLYVASVCVCWRRRRRLSASGWPVPARPSVCDRCARRLRYHLPAAASASRLHGMTPWGRARQGPGLGAIDLLPLRWPLQQQRQRCCTGIQQCRVSAIVWQPPCIV